jgi:RNA polymerase sigma-70 factor (ECF subfamily)
MPAPSLKPIEPALAGKAASRRAGGDRRGPSMSQPLDGAVTTLLRAVEAGDGEARRRLFDVLYEELRRIARGVVPGHANDTALQPTALVHEAYIRLVQDHERHFVDRHHFLSYAAVAMRSIVVDHARARRRQKRGGDQQRTSLDAIADELTRRAGDLVALDDALTKLAAIDPLMVDIVNLRFFVGLTVEETAAALRQSKRTIEREWQVAKTWLRSALT